MFVLLKRTWLFESRIRVLHQLDLLLFATLISYCHLSVVILSILPLRLLGTLLPCLSVDYRSALLVSIVFVIQWIVVIRPRDLSGLTSLAFSIGHTVGVPSSNGLLIPIGLWFVTTALVPHTVYYFTADCRDHLCTCMALCSAHLNICIALPQRFPIFV